MTKVVGPYGVAGTNHSSQVIVLPTQKVSQTFIKSNFRPKQKLLGLRLALMNV